VEVRVFSDELLRGRPRLPIGPSRLPSPWNGLCLEVRSFSAVASENPFTSRDRKRELNSWQCQKKCIERDRSGVGLRALPFKDNDKHTDCKQKQRDREHCLIQSVRYDEHSFVERSQNTHGCKDRELLTGTSPKTANRRPIPKPITRNPSSRLVTIFLDRSATPEVPPDPTRGETTCSFSGNAVFLAVTGNSTASARERPSPAPGELSLSGGESDLLAVRTCHCGLHIFSTRQEHPPALLSAAMVGGGRNN
jgi:hypothetical protein